MRRRVLPPEANAVGCVRKQYVSRPFPQPQDVLQEQEVVSIQPMEMDLPSVVPEPSAQQSNPEVQGDIAALLEYRPPPVQHPQAGK